MFKVLGIISLLFIIGCIDNPVIPKCGSNLYGQPARHNFSGDQNSKNLLISVCEITPIEKLIKSNDLAVEVTADPEAAYKKYQGATINIIGIVEGVHDLPFEPFIRLRGYNYIAVDCSINIESLSEDIDNIVGFGDTAIISGVFNEWEGRNVSITDCKIEQVIELDF